MSLHRYERGDLLAEANAQGVPYRVERRLVDIDTKVMIYQLKLINSNEEVFRSSKLVESSAMRLVLSKGDQ